MYFIKCFINLYEDWRIGLLNPIFNLIKPDSSSIIFIVDYDSFKLPIYNSNIKNNFTEIKSASRFNFKILDFDWYWDYNYNSYLILNKSKTQQWQLK